MRRVSLILLVLLFTFALSACVAAPSEKPGGAVSENTTQNTTQSTEKDPATQDAPGNEQTPENKLSGDFTPADTSTVTGPIDEKQAKEIALKHAGLSPDKIRDYDIEREQIGGTSFYEIDFESGEYDYEYLIRIDNGKIQKSYKELDRD